MMKNMHMQHTAIKIGCRIDI